MANEFTVDDRGMTSDGYRRLLPSSRKSMYLANMIKVAIATAIVLWLFINWTVLFPDSDSRVRYVAVAVYAIFLIYWLVGPEVFYRRYRYRIDDDKAEIRRGIIVITHSLVPIERIHQVQVDKGPINRLFGLANVVITTAGGVTALELLDEDTAESIASKLNECVVKLLKDRD